MKTGAALKPLSFQNGQVFPFFAFVKGDNFEYVQEKEEEEKRLGGELHTQTFPSGQVLLILQSSFCSSDLKHSGATDNDRRVRVEEDAGWAQWASGD